jgi:hypothetical protein
MRRAMLVAAGLLALVVPQAQAGPGGGAETGTTIEHHELGNTVAHFTIDPAGGFHTHVSGTSAPSTTAAKLTESHTGNFTKSSSTNTTVFNGETAFFGNGHVNTHENSNKTGASNVKCNENKEVTFCP